MDITVAVWVAEFVAVLIDELTGVGDAVLVSVLIGVFVNVLVIAGAKVGVSVVV